MMYESTIQKGGKIKSLVSHTDEITTLPFAATLSVLVFLSSI